MSLLWLYCLCGQKRIVLCAQFFSLPVRRPGAPQTLPELLNAYAFVRPFGGLVVPWIMFGPSGHTSRCGAARFACMRRGLLPPDAGPGCAQREPAQTVT